MSERLVAINLFSLVKSVDLMLPIKINQVVEHFVKALDWSKFLEQVNMYAGHSSAFHKKLIRILGIVAGHGLGTGMYSDAMNDKMREWSNIYNTEQLVNLFLRYFEFQI